MFKFLKFILVVMLIITFGSWSVIGGAYWLQIESFPYQVMVIVNHYAVLLVTLQSTLIALMLVWFLFSWYKKNKYPYGIFIDLKKNTFSDDKLYCECLLDKKGNLIYTDNNFQKIFQLLPYLSLTSQSLMDVLTYNKQVLLINKKQLAIIANSIEEDTSCCLDVLINNNIYSRYFRINLLNRNEYYLCSVQLIKKDMLIDNSLFQTDVLDRLPVPFIIINNYGKTLFANEFFFEMFSLHKNLDFADINFSDFVVDKYLIDKITISNINNTDYKIDKCILKDSNDNQFIAYLSQSMYYDVNNKFRYVRVVILPDTLKLTTESDANNQDSPIIANNFAIDYIHTILEKINVSVFVLDVENNITYMNNASKDLFNLVDNAYYSLVDLFGNYTSEILQQLNLSNSYEFTIDLSMIDQLYHLNCVIYKEVSYSVLLISDHTETKKIEKDLKLYRGLQTLGQLASSVAHDFNNLLTAIQGNIYFLQQKLDSDDAMFQDVANMDNIANRARVLIKQLLTFSRSSEISPILIDVNAELSDLFFTIVKLLGDKLTVSFQKDLTRNYKILFDRGHFSQIITNLATNAKDAMRDKGSKLLIKTSLLTLNDTVEGVLGSIAPGVYVLIEVRDDGQGIPYENLKLIFQSHFSTKGEQGNGLGLHTILSILKDHGGFIDVDSMVGEYTAFYLYFPAHLSNNEIGDLINIDINTNNNKDSITKDVEQIIDDTGYDTILLVEDDYSVRHVIVKVLIAKGYNVYQAESGELAMQLIKNTPDIVFDLLISDVSMPEITGPELVGMVKDVYPNIKVLLISGYSNDVLKDMEGDNFLKGIHFLSKPFNPSALSKKVKAILTQEKT